MKDIAYLEHLTEGQYFRLDWYATHPPRPLTLQEIPDDPTMHRYWHALPHHEGNRKVYPRYTHYLFACKKFGIKPHPRWESGIPSDILKSFVDYRFPNSFRLVFTFLYNSSHYNTAWKMRVSEISVGLISKKLSVSSSTTKRCLSALRKFWFVRLVWRGSPDPQTKRYLHSCYELPLNLNHVISWRINNGRKRRKT